METTSLGIGVGIGIAIGFALGIVIMLVWKNNTDASGGVMYTYDKDNRLQAMMPMNKNVQMITLKPAESE